ncbi:Uncharacterised protein [Salmonella enterica subsp. enterica serovar Paratyphi A]|nr:Uncharacterised protein [Salmonella enterica subsp. enterica serovar Paratyphi A]
MMLIMTLVFILIPSMLKTGRFGMILPFCLKQRKLFCGEMVRIKLTEKY